MYCGCVIRFYFLSSDKEAGCGAGESLCSNCEYSKLNSIQNWRQTLSSFYLCPMYDDYGNEFNCVMQMYKCIDTFCDYNISYDKCYEIFSHLNQKESKHSTKNTPVKKEVLQYVLKSKYSNNYKLMDILKLTGTSKLVYYNLGEDYIENMAEILENVRNNE